MSKPRPYLTAALLCERVLHEQDNSLSVIRIADRVTVEIPKEGMPGGIKPVFRLSGLVAVKSGPAIGDFELSVNLIRPSQKREPAIVFPVKLLGNDQGQNLILNMTIGFEEEGLHWVSVLFDGEELTRIPLMVVRTEPQPLGK